MVYQLTRNTFWRNVLLFGLKRKFSFQFVSFNCRFSKSETSLNFSTFDQQDFVKTQIKISPVITSLYNVYSLRGTGPFNFPLQDVQRASSPLK